MKRLLLFYFCVLLFGCSPSFQVVPVEYDEPVSIKTNHRATLEFLTGMVTGRYGPGNEFNFTVQDQQIFFTSLKNELNRLGLVRIVEKGVAPEDPIDINIKIRFDRTYYSPTVHEYLLLITMHEYLLYARMEIKGEKGTFHRKYRILSWEGDSLWQKMKTLAWEGKEQAAKKLLRVLIKDIEEYLIDNHQEVRDRPNKSTQIPP